MTYRTWDEANQTVSDLIGLLCSIGAMLEDSSVRNKEIDEVLSLIGHGLNAAGNPVFEWQELGPIPEEFVYLPIFLHNI